jgi:hypothetical protein
MIVISDIPGMALCRLEFESLNVQALIKLGVGCLIGPDWAYEFVAHAIEIH